jgi:hypothetical protein
VVNLLTLPLDLTNFLVKRLRLILEKVTTCQTLPVKSGVVPLPLGGGTILSFILGVFSWLPCQLLRLAYPLM